MKRKLPCLLMAGAVLFGVRAYAHHPFASAYIETREVTIEGSLVEMSYRDPHSFLHVMALDGSQQPERWIVEWSGSGRLNRQGISEETLKPGDHVIVTGNPGRDTWDNRVRVRSIVRPSDGWTWTRGTSW